MSKEMLMGIRGAGVDDGVEERGGMPTIVGMGVETGAIIIKVSV
jgi:uncharacterized protein (DUF433 family)